MAKLITKGFTDYFGAIEEITILAYDNNKYVHIRRSNGEEDHIKRGYIAADNQLLRRIGEVHWHVHGGGTRRTYKRRQQKTTYRVFSCEETKVSINRGEFSSKAKAIAYASRKAAEAGCEVEVSELRRVRYAFSTGVRYVICNPHGIAVEFNAMKRRRAGKYLKGYGKLPNRAPF